MKPRILFLTDQEEIVGGVEVGFLELLLHIDRDRFEYCVAGPSGPLLQAAGSLAETIVCPLRPLRTKPAPLVFPQLIRRAAVLRSTFRAGQAFRPDLVHTLSFGAHLSGAGLARDLGAPVVWDVQDYFSHPFERFLLKRAARKSRPHAMFLGEETAKRFPSTGPGRRREITAGVDVDRFAGSREDSILRTEYDVNTTDPIIGYVGQLIPRKRVEVLIEATIMARQSHPKLQLGLIGAPSERFADYGRTLAKSVRAHPWIHMLGARRDVERLLPDVDVLVFPSLEEPFGRVVLEAMASRVPVVAAASSGAARALPGSAYRLAGDGSARSMGQAVIDLLDSPEERMSLATEGRRVVEERFSASARARAVSAYHGEILALD